MLTAGDTGVCAEYDRPSAGDKGVCGGYDCTLMAGNKGVCSSSVVAVVHVRGHVLTVLAV